MNASSHELIQTLSGLNPASQFVSIKGYKNNSGDVSDYSFLLNISYSRAVEKSKKLLLDEKIVYPFSDKFNIWDFQQARQELLKSFSLTLENKNHSTSEDAYCPIFGENGKELKGCKLFVETRTIHLYGFVVWKNSIISSPKKEVKSSAKTLAKNDIMRQLPISKFVQFSLREDKFEKLTIAGFIFLPQNVPSLDITEYLQMAA